jgi:hypothetical protein
MFGYTVVHVVIIVKLCLYILTRSRCYWWGCIHICCLGCALHKPIGIRCDVCKWQFYITRMHSLPLTPKQKQREWTLIQLIAQNNNFPQKLIQNLNLQLQHKNTNQDQTNGKNKNKKWTRGASINLRVTRVKCHILDKQATVRNRDIRNT